MLTAQERAIADGMVEPPRLTAVVSATSVVSWDYLLPISTLSKDNHRLDNGCGSVRTSRALTSLRGRERRLSAEPIKSGKYFILPRWAIQYADLYSCASAAN